MDARAAIDETMEALKSDKWDIYPVTSSHLGHLYEMHEKVDMDRRMSEDKLNRWLGFMQGVICVCTTASIEEMIEINKKHVT